MGEEKKAKYTKAKIEKVNYVSTKEIFQNMSEYGNPKTK
jgi:hypothetical protein